MQLAVYMEKTFSININTDGLHVSGTKPTELIILMDYTCQVQNQHNLSSYC
jgi:hypothetical protein